jgi:hypothetical protein
MPDYGQPLQFGLSITPDADDLSAVAGMTSLAESAGYDLIAIQDHAYQPRFLDTWTLLTYLAARTERIRFLPDVADLALRPPAMLAKATDVRRLYNVLGSIGLRAGGRGLHGPSELWADTLASWATELGFDTFVFWPTDSSPAQAELFAREVLPAVRDRVADQRTAAPLDR